MLNSKILGISLVLVIFVSSIPLVFSDNIRDQIEQGIGWNQLKCDNEDHVLVERDNGKLACVYETTAKKMEKFEWEVIEYIPYTNPGHWLPIPEEEQDDFANKFVNALGDSILWEISPSENIYKVNSGKLVIDDNHVKYYSNELMQNNNFDFTIAEKFMENMGFDADAFDMVMTIRYSVVTIVYEKEPVGVKFIFKVNSDKEITYVGVNYNGWTDEPRINFPLSEKIAVKKAIEFINKIDPSVISEELDKYGSDVKFACEFQMIEPEIHKRVISGIPFYKIEIMLCDYVVTDYPESKYIVITLDALTGKNISLSVMDGIGLR